MDLAGPTQLTGPLSQFQAKTAQQAGMRDLVRSLASVAGIAEHVADARFEVYWPQLEVKIAAAVAASAADAGHEEEPRRDQADVLDEILLHVRQLRAESEGGKHALLRPSMLSVKVAPPIHESVIAAAAPEFGLKLLRFVENADGTASITVSPGAGKEHSDATVERFTAALRDTWGERVTTTAVPF